MGGLDKDFREMVEQELNDSRKQLEVGQTTENITASQRPGDDRT
ncbi:MAG: hypothetical protein ACLRRA_03915 [Acutalibacteraceae bacterium]